jgi:hypothetical protein
MITEHETLLQHLWIKEFPGSIIVCDTDGLILEMNDKAARGYEKEGGLKLIGSNLLDCHPEKARRKIEELLVSRQANIYTIEKKGIKKFVYQSPWYRDGQYAGIVELVLEIPFEMPHFVRS